MKATKKALRDAILIARAQLASRFPGVDHEYEINAYFRRRGETHARIFVAMRGWYEYALENDECPMLSNAEWARRFGISKCTFRDHWKDVRGWKIGVQYVFAEGAHALRTLAYYEGERGEKRQITAGGVGLRFADLPRLPDKWSMVVVDSTAETTRVMRATTFHAAQNIEHSVTATTEEKSHARAQRVAGDNAVAQLPLRIVGTGTDGR